MYREFFGLTDLPFRSTPDLDFFYTDADRDGVVNAILYSLKRGDGIIKVVGEVGSGKTTILRSLSNRLSPEFSCVYVNSPNLSPRDILFFICNEFGISIDPNDQKFFLTQKLHNFLLKEHGLGRRPLLLIDEAQATPIETLEEIRLLTNLETDHDKLLQIVMFGQPELDVNLNQPSIRQFLSRISHSIELKPFSREDTQSYLNFRMRRAGYKGKDLFTSAISRTIHQLSGGLPREIHSLADKALLVGYAKGSLALRSNFLEGGFSFYRQVALILSFIFLMLISYFLYVFLKPSFATLSLENSGTVIEESHTDVTLQVNSDLTSQASLEAKITEKDFVTRFFERLQSDATVQYSLQLMVGDLAVLRNTLRRVESIPGIDAEQVYYSINPTSNQFTLYYGYFVGFSSAQNTIVLFPPSIMRSKPFVAPRSDILKELNFSLIQLNNQS